MSDTMKDKVVVVFKNEVRRRIEKRRAGAGDERFQKAPHAFLYGREVRLNRVVADG